MVVQIVRFRTECTADEVVRKYRERAERYRQVPGLLQKHYLSFSETGEFGAVYLWTSREALQKFRESDLAKSIPQAYRVLGTPEIQVADVTMSLYDDAHANA
jgi:heme-degrading monooxygenase HmoA